MTRYVALLRGVNVGGVTMKMADLADVVRSLGFDGVRTVLASGNVLFETADAASGLKARLEAALRERFGYEAWVHVLTVAQIEELIAAYPFERDAERHAYVVFVLKPELRDALLAVELDPAVEQAAAGDGVVYWTVPTGSTLDSALGKAQASAKHQTVAVDPQPQHAREADPLSRRQLNRRQAERGRRTADAIRRPRVTATPNMPWM